MTRNDAFIDLLEEYLDDFEGATPMSSSDRDAIRAALPSTHQRPAWWPGWRFPPVNNIAKFSLAAAVVVVAALLGLNYFVAPNIGGPDLDESSPTPTPRLLTLGALEPGTYRLTARDPEASVEFADDATLTVPTGWTSRSGLMVAKGVAQTMTAVVFWVWPEDLTHVYRDPCAWRSSEIDPPVGPSVDDLANALANQAQRGEALPRDVSVGGYSGKMIELTVPADVDLNDCDDAEFRSWAGRYHQGPGQIDDVYILDVRGERLVIFQSYMPGTSDADIAEGRAIIDSIELGGS